MCEYLMGDISLGNCKRKSMEYSSVLLPLHIHVHGATCFHATCGTGVPIHSSRHKQDLS